MSSVVLWLSLTASPGLLADAGPSTATVRAAQPEHRPRRRSQGDGNGAPRIQMGMGPTALAMLALIAAVIGRSVRRRRADPTAP